MNAKQIVLSIIEGWDDDEDDSWGDDDLESFLEDTIYDTEKDRIQMRGGGRNNDSRYQAQAVAAKKAKLFTAQIIKLVGKEFEAPDYGVVGGHADGGGFSLELEDGREIEGNENGARFISKPPPPQSL